ncbi:MAG: hypothetical protein AAB368_14760, partial [bacterium]
MSITERLARVRELLTRHGLDGWLFVGGTAPDPALGAVFRVQDAGRQRQRYHFRLRQRSRLS